MDVPMTYRQVNERVSSAAPTGLQLLNNGATQYYARYLMQRAISAIKITGRPTGPGWSRTYFDYTIFGRGFGCVINTDRYGVIFQGGPIYGRDVCYQPTTFQTANPLLPSKSYRIGRDAALIRLKPDYSGIEDLVTTYAMQLALSYQTWVTATQNSKVAYILAADNKANAHTFDSMVDKVMSGEVAVAVGAGMLDPKTGQPRWQMYNQDVSKTYIAPDVSEEMRRITERFDRLIGLPHANTDKRERLTTDEVHAEDTQTSALVDLWIETLNESFDECARLFPEIRMHAERRYKDQQTEEAMPND